MPLKQTSWISSGFTSLATQQSDNGGAFVQVKPGKAYTAYSGTQASISTDNGTGGDFRPCEHYKKYVRYPGLNLNLVNTDAVSFPKTRKGEDSYCFATFANTFHNALAGSGDLSSINLDWSALGAQAVAAMLPSLSNGVNLMTFLIELRDFKKLGQALYEKAIGLKLLEATIGLKLTKSGKSANGIVKDASSSYLSYMFAWKPLINDLVSISNNLTAFNKRLDEYVRRAGTPQQRYWGVNVSGAISSNRLIQGGTNSSGIRSGWTPGVNYRIEEYDAQPARYSATMRYRYTMSKDLIEKARGLGGFLDMLGVNANPQTIWNAIPFSFLVDWVVNIGSYLSRLRVDNVDMRSTTEILDFCHSVKGKRKYRFTVDMINRNSAGVSTAEGKPKEYALAEISYYRRIKTIPNIYAALTTSGLSGTEMLLGGALVATRYKK